MKQVSSKFKNQIKELGREIDSIITYYNHYKFITEDNQYILTEDGQKILTEQINRDNVVEITAEDIYNEKIITHGDILSTMMKEFDFEVRQDMQIGSIVNVKFGVKVDNEYEYIDYGDFIVNQKEYKEDTKTYSYIAYDFMLLTMTPFKAPNLSEVSGEYTIYDLFDYICSYCHLNNGVEMFANSEREFYNVNSLEELGYTNRDILDFISEISGSSIACIDYNLVPLTPTEVSNNLPKEYTQVEYIESDGNGSYIDTNYFPNTKTKINLDFKYIRGTGGAVPILGERPTEGGNNTKFAIWTNNYDKSALNFGSYDSGYVANSNPKVRNILSNDNAKLYYNNNLVASGSNRTFTSTLSLYIFGLHTNSGVDYRGQVWQLYSFKIYDDNILVRDFVPCYRNSDNEIGLYDLVNDDFYTNQGSGSFIAGTKVVVPFNEEYFKDTNVNFNKVYGPINSILFSRSDDTDVIEIKDDESISTNGVTQIKIKDNPFLEDNDRSDYQEELFDVLNGLTYTLNDLDSIGICYLDYYDKYKVQIADNTYDCLLLNDEISINQGLEEKIFTEEYEGTTQEYVTSRLSDKDQKWANIQVKKDLGEISLEVGQKVNSDEVITAINLSPEQAVISSNKVSLQGKTINLTSDTINIASNNFSVDTNGNMTCSNANVTGGEINLTGAESTNAKFTITSSSNTNTKVMLLPTMARFYKNNTELVQINTSMATPFIVVGNYSAIGQASNLQPDGVHTQSDIRLKENIEDIKEENSIKFITSLNPIEYTFKKSKIYHKGLSAQDVEEKSENQKTKIYSKDKDGYYTINYVELIPDLINCIKYQQEEIEKLKERIDNK